jgi:hypothetical protein
MDDIQLTVPFLLPMTNDSPPSDQDNFQQELDALRLILKQNLHKLKEDPFLGTQVEFWLESAKFMETNLEIWEDTGNAYKHQQAMERMRKVLDSLQQLINQMNNHSGDDIP